MRTGTSRETWTCCASVNPMVDIETGRHTTFFSTFGRSSTWRDSRRAGPTDRGKVSFIIGNITSLSHGCKCRIWRSRYASEGTSAALHRTCFSIHISVNPPRGKAGFLWELRKVNLIAVFYFTIHFIFHRLFRGGVARPLVHDGPVGRHVVLMTRRHQCKAEAR